MFSVTISPRAQNELKRLKKNYEIGLIEVINELRDDPFMGKPLRDDLTGKYSYKIGVLRIIYKINVNDKKVLIVSAGHRSIIYN